MEVARSLKSEKAFSNLSALALKVSAEKQLQHQMLALDTTEESSLLLDAALTLCSLAAKNVEIFSNFNFTIILLICIRWVCRRNKSSRQLLIMKWTT